MRRISAAMFIAIGGACASTPPPQPPQPAVATVGATSAKPAKPLPTTLLPGVGMSTDPKPADVDDDNFSGPPPACGADEDCWSKSCCPAKVPEECVHASRARKCAIVDISCKPTPIHYTCVCNAGTCMGRLAPP